MRIPKPVLGGFLVLLLLAAGAYLLFFNKAPAKPGNQVAGASGSDTGQSAAQAPGQKAPPAALPVKAVKAIKGDLIITLKSPGEAYTREQVTLKAEVGGVVKTLYAAEGRHVKAGDVLAELDDRTYRLNLEQRQALRLQRLSELFLEKQFATSNPEISPAAVEKVNKAEAEYQKAAAAFQKGLASQSAFEAAQKDYEIALIEAGRKKDEIMATTKGLTQAELDVKLAQMDLEKTRIRAPFAGILTEIKISPREHIDPGRELCTLVNISRIWVKAKILESEIGKIKAGREVDLRFSAYPGKVFKGTVEAVSPIVNAEDKTCAVHIALSNPAEEIKPGMHAEVEIAAEIYKDRLLVPQEAILVRGGRKLVFVVENGLAKWRYVKIGLENEIYAEILAGERPEETVNVGDLVIIEGHFTLAHDASVTIKE
ncbi:MAG: efflux RND transporter periplasmic adaptor subunit [Candidatus Aminicenantales bacterium]